MTECPKTKVLNPKTNRCVNINGKLGRAIVKSKLGKTKQCDPSKVLNPITNRCVNVNGRIGKNIKLYDAISIENYANSKTLDEAIALQMNYIVLDRIKTLHTEWIQHTNKFAIFEANYLVDYYCSLTIIIGDEQDMFIPDPTIQQMKSRQMHWTSIPTTTYEILKHNLSYNVGYQMSKDKLISLKNRVVKQGNLTDIMSALSSTASKNFVWGYINMKSVFDAIRVVNKQEEIYYASSHGMYRFVNMHFIDEEQKVQTILNPCNCICFSLRTLMVLSLLGYPKDKLFLLPQKINDNYKKITHWAIACDDLNLYTKSTFQSMPKKSFSSTDAFMYFTRNLIHFYRISLENYKVNNKNTRRLILKHLLDLFDYEFVHGIMTPT